MMKFFYIVAACFLCSIVKCQIIEGTVYHENETVPFSNVLLYNLSSPELIESYTSTDDNGQYAITLSKAADSLLIEVTSLSFEPQKKRIKAPVKGETMKVDFRLEMRTTELKEVIVERKQPITQKKDTVVYNPEAFRDGSERVVEDLLRKLPGIKIEQSGEIKYKGKSIKKLLLDGDDLFSSQYTIGSKNINVDMIENVQAIEHFNENALLRGLTNSNDVALNLKLKKGKADLSGDASLGYGYRDKYNSRLTGLVVSKKSKGFLISGYNNVGENFSPYNFASLIPSVESLQEKDHAAKEIIEKGNFHSAVNDKYHRINRNFYSSVNFLSKFSEAVTAKFNGGFYNDELKRYNRAQTEYTSSGAEFTIYQNEDIVKSPTLYDANLQLVQKLKDSITWEYIGKISYRDENFKSFGSNNGLLQNSKTNTYNFFTKHNLNFTKRINKSSALTFTGIYSLNTVPENFSLSPGLNLNANYPGEVLENYQGSRFDKHVVSATADYYITFNDYKIKLSGFYRDIQNDYQSQLLGYQSEGIVFTDRQLLNNMYYRYTTPGASISFSKLFNDKFGVGAGFTAQYYSFTLNDKIQGNFQTENNLILSPSVSLLYILSKKSGISASYSFSPIAPQENLLFTGIVQTSLRNFRNNQPDFNFLKSHSCSLGYNFNNFFELTSFSAMLTYNYRPNNYFFKNVITPQTTVNTAFLSNTSSRDYNAVVNGERYIDFIKSTLQLTAGYTLLLDKNIVNGSNLRNIEMQYMFYDFTIRRSFNNVVEIENKMMYNKNNFVVEGVGKNNNSNITDAVKVLYKYKTSLKASVSANIISTDLSAGNNYCFLDAELRYTTKNKKFDFTLTGRNLTNYKTFETIYVSDYYRSVVAHNLIERFIVASVDFRF